MEVKKFILDKISTPVPTFQQVKVHENVASPVFYLHQYMNLENAKNEVHAKFWYINDELQLVLRKMTRVTFHDKNASTAID